VCLAAVVCFDSGVVRGCDGLCPSRACGWVCATVIFGFVFGLSPLLCVVVQVFIGGIETLGFGK